jgi:hypothetical protein
MAVLGVRRMDRSHAAGDRVAAGQTPIAVFGEEHSLAPAATRARSTAAEPEHDVAYSAQVLREIAERLRQCARDLPQTSCYAPVLDDFYHQRGISGDKAVEQRRRFLQLYPTVYRYDISDVRLESITSERAVVTFTREWDMAGARRYAGASRHLATLVKMNGVWKIASEQEKEVYWTKRR